MQARGRFIAAMVVISLSLPARGDETEVLQPMREAFGEAGSATTSGGPPTVDLAQLIEQFPPIDKDAGEPIDVAIVIDVSGSTRMPSGADLDGDGEVGVNPHMEAVSKLPGHVVNTDPDDSILMVEIHIGEAVLDRLDFSRDRAALVTFAGDPRTNVRAKADQADATLEVALSRDPTQLREALARIARAGGRGGTNWAAGLDVAIQELTKDPARSVRRLIVFLTDGVPSLPYGSGNVSDPEDQEAALAVSRRAARAKVPIRAYVIGSMWNSNAEELTEATGGQTVHIWPDLTANTNPVFQRMREAFGAEGDRSEDE